MPRFRPRLSIVVAWVLLSVLHVACGFAQSGFARLSERNLRRAAVSVTSPQYPEQDIKNHTTGVAVAEIRIDEKGKLFNVTMLEKPSDTIAAAMEKALAQWKFNGASVGGQPYNTVAKVTYYFVFQNGRPVVLSPEEAPYLGPLGVRGR